MRKYGKVLPHAASLLGNKSFAAMKNLVYEKIIEKVEEKEFQGSAQGVSLIEGLDARPCLLLSP